MSDMSASFYDDFINKRDQILERHYHHLTRVIRPRNFYAWLRVKGVLTIADQEEIENKYITTCLKAGHLVDIVATKGKAGFMAFMEVIEYEYPELFTIMVAKQPRQPPEDYNPQTGQMLRKRLTVAKSAEVLTLMGKIAMKLTQELEDKNSRFMELQKLIDQMKMERQQESEEHETLYRDLQTANEAIEGLTAERDRLRNEMAKMKIERDEFNRQCAELRAQKDEFMDECTKLRVSSGATQRSPSLHESKGSTESGGGCDVEDVFTTLKHRAETDQKRLAAEKIAELQKQCQISQETSNKCLATVEQLKCERDQVLKQNEDLKVKYDNAMEKNVRLEDECQGYVEKFRRMEETMQNLHIEIDQLKLMRSVHQKLQEPRSRAANQLDYA
jgi:chromosome segregation ATPase